MFLFSASFSENIALERPTHEVAPTTLAAILADHRFSAGSYLFTVQDSFELRHPFSSYCVVHGFPNFTFTFIVIIIITIRTFVTRAVSANILNLRRRQSLGEEDGGSEV